MPVMWEVHVDYAEGACKFNERDTLFEGGAHTTHPKKGKVLISLSVTPAQSMNYDNNCNIVIVL